MSKELPSERQLSERFDRALALASDLHRTQARKGTEIPYMSHLLAVAGLVIEAGGDEDQAIAALLHDAPEDQRERMAELGMDIEEEFGSRVQRIILDCTDDDPGSDKRDEKNWRLRKERYLDHLKSVLPDALLVSCADKLHNAGSIVRDLSLVGERLWDRFNAPKEDQLWYYQRVVGAFRSRDLKPAWVVDEFERLVDAMESGETT